MDQHLRSKAWRAMGWTFSQQAGTQLIRFVITVFLARLLLPQDFGIIGMVVVITTLGQVLMDGGMGSSLIRSENPDERDYSSVFFINLLMSLVIYSIVFWLAPLFASFFRQPELIPIIRVYCLSFIVHAFSMVQLTRLTKQMDFRTQFLISLPSLLAGGITGVACALSGMGVWSLVWMHLIQTTLNTVQVWIRSKWKPALIFDAQKLRNHFSFGYKLTLSALLFRGYKNLINILIGRYFPAEQLGFYTRAQTMKQLPIDSLSNALNRVTYPLFASIQQDEQRLKSAYRTIMQQVLFWICPLLTFAAVLAEPLFRFLLTEKWLPAVPYFQILCVVGIMYPLHAYNLNILNVKGRSDLFLKLEVIKVASGTLMIFAGLQFGMYGLLVAEVILNVYALGINAWYSGSFIRYSLKDQIADLMPVVLLTLFCGVLVYFLNTMLSNQTDIIRLVAGAGTGMAVYLTVAHWLKLSPVIELKKLVFSQ